MPKRGENIRKRKDGRWEGRFKIGNDSNGKTLYHSVYAKSYSEVKEKMKNGRVLDAVKEKNESDNEITFSEVLFLWLDSIRISVKESTYYRYEYIINRHICPELGVLKLSQITSQLINTFLDCKSKGGRLDKKGGLSPSYVKSIMLIIKAAIDFATDEELCKPLRTKINKPVDKSKELPILCETDQRRLEDHLRCNMDITGIGIMISLYSGLRIGEICALTWDDIDLTNKVIHVRHTIARVRAKQNNITAKSILIVDEPKTKASRRDIPISTVLMPLLSDAKKHSESIYVASDKKDFVSPRTYEYRYHQALKECGVEQVNYHALRHTFATRCVAAGVDIKSLSEMLGHANAAITLNTYVHSSMDMKRNQLEKLSSFFA